MSDAFMPPYTLLERILMECFASGVRKMVGVERYLVEVGRVSEQTASRLGFVLCFMGPRKAMRRRVATTVAIAAFLTPACASQSLPQATGSQSLPQATLLLDGKTYGLDAYSWCWHGQDHGACETVAVPDCSKAPSVTRVRAGASGRVTVNRAPNSLDIEVKLMGADHMSLISADRDNRFMMPNTSGRYLLLVDGRWPDGQVIYAKCLDLE